MGVYTLEGSRGTFTSRENTHSERVKISPFLVSCVWASSYGIVTVVLYKCSHQLIDKTLIDCFKK